MELAYSLLGVILYGERVLHGMRVMKRILGEDNVYRFVTGKFGEVIVRMYSATSNP